MNELWLLIWFTCIQSYPCPRFKGTGRLSYQYDVFKSSANAILKYEELSKNLPDDYKLDYSLYKIEKEYVIEPILPQPVHKLKLKEVK